MGALPNAGAVTRSAQRCELQQPLGEFGAGEFEEQAVTAVEALSLRLRAGARRRREAL